MTCRQQENRGDEQRYGQSVSCFLSLCQGQPEQAHTYVDSPEIVVEEVGDDRFADGGVGRDGAHEVRVVEFVVEARGCRPERHLRDLLDATHQRDGFRRGGARRAHDNVLRLGEVRGHRPDRCGCSVEHRVVEEHVTVSELAQLRDDAAVALVEHVHGDQSGQAHRQPGVICEKTTHAHTRTVYGHMHTALQRSAPHCRKCARCQVQLSMQPSSNSEATRAHSRSSSTRTSQHTTTNAPDWPLTRLPVCSLGSCRPAQRALTERLIAVLAVGEPVEQLGPEVQLRARTGHAPQQQRHGHTHASTQCRRRQSSPPCAAGERACKATGVMSRPMRHPSHWRPNNFHPSGTSISKRLAWKLCARQVILVESERKDEKGMLKSNGERSFSLT